jgi:nucleotide-binding universal stress UspA family protein
MHSPNRILVPVDFSDTSRAALRYAAVLGAEVGASVDVLYVWRPPGDVDSRRTLLVEFARSDEGHKMMEWLAVMGTHAHQGFWRQLLGGVTEEIVRRAPCPVLTIRTEDYPPVEWIDTKASDGAIAAQPM